MLNPEQKEPKLGDYSLLIDYRDDALSFCYPDNKGRKCARQIGAHTLCSGCPKSHGY